MARVATISEFTKVFRFEGFIRSANTSGGYNEDFTGYFNTRGKWEKIDGSREFNDGKDYLISVYRVTCFWRSGLEAMIDKNTRLIYDNKTFRVERMERVNEDRRLYQFIVSEAH